MSSPLVAGVAALILQQDLTLTVSQVKQKIIDWETPNIIQYSSSLGGGKNLLYSPVISDQNAPTPAPTHKPPPTFKSPPSSLLIGGNGNYIHQSLSLLYILSTFFIMYIF